MNKNHWSENDLHFKSIMIEFSHMIIIILILFRNNWGRLSPQRLEAMGAVKFFFFVVSMLHWHIFEFAFVEFLMQQYLLIILTGHLNFLNNDLPFMDLDHY